MRYEKNYSNLLGHYKLNIALIALFLSFQMPIKGQYEFWTLGTAKTLPQKQFESGVFTPLRYGLTHRIELGAYILSEPMVPNFRGKIHWYTIPEWDILIATRHGIYVPTPGLKYVQNNEPFGLTFLRPEDRPPAIYAEEQRNFWDPPKKVPFITVFSNELLLSKVLIKKTSCSPPNLLLTIKLGVNNGLVRGESTMPVIDKPLLYQRSVTFRDTVLWYVGADLEGHLNSRFDFSVDVDFLSVDWQVERFAIEHKALLLYYFTPALKLVAGYKFSFGEYPSGWKPYISPAFDIIYNFTLRAKQDGLFRNDPYKRPHLKE